jgi:hypothetical protein
MELELTSFLIIERSSEMEGPREAVYSSIIESKRLRFLLVFLIFAGPNPRAMLDTLSETFNTGHRDFVNATYIPALPEISSCASGASGSQLNSIHASISSPNLRRKYKSHSLFSSCTFRRRSPDRSWRFAEVISGDPIRLAPTALKRSVECRPMVM